MVFVYTKQSVQPELKCPLCVLVHCLAEDMHNSLADVCSCQLMDPVSCHFLYTLCNKKKRLKFFMSEIGSDVSVQLAL
jgi:hypothetical protein